MKKLAIIIMSLFVLFSCDSNLSDIEQSKKSSREEFLQGKSYGEIKESYLKLEEKQKISLWIDKLSQLENIENLPNPQIELIQNLKYVLINYKSTKDLSKIQEIAIKLAQITPENDFIEMFGSLNNYNYEGKFKDTTISTRIINDLASLSNPNINAPKSLEKGKPNCNCKWTCGFMSNYNSQGSNCIQTSTGCGFLWLQECNEHA